MSFKSSLDNETSFLYTIFGVHFLVTKQENLFENNCTEEISTRYIAAAPITYKGISIEMDAQGMRIGEGLSHEDTAKAVLCYLANLAYDIKLKGFHDEICSEIREHPQAPEVSRILKKIRILDFQFNDFRKNSPVMRGDLETQGLMASIAHLADAQNARSSIKDNILAFAERIEPQHHEGQETPALFVAVSTLFITMLSWVTSKLDLLKGNNILVLWIALAHLCWFAWIFSHPPRSIWKFAFQILLFPGLTLWLTFMIFGK